MKNPKQLALVMRGARAEMKMIPRFSLTRWLSGLKARGTVRAFRAHLIAACVAAMSIQLVALTTIFFAGVPENLFETNMFRLSAAALVLSVVGAIRCVAWIAFVAAIGRNDVTFLDARHLLVSVSATCPRRQLVILHTRFAGLAEDICS